MTTRCALALLLLCALTSHAAPLKNLIQDATVSASSMASPAGGKYGVARLHDGEPNTHWASRARYKLPQWIKVEWKQPVTLDTVAVDIFWRGGRHIYAAWKAAGVTLSDGATASCTFDLDSSEFAHFRFDRPHTVTSATLHILEVYDPKTYVGINELGFHLDPQRRIAPPKKVVAAKPQAELKPQGRPTHPCVYVNQDDLARARRNAEQTDWGKAEKATILKQAAKWLEHDEAYWLGFLPEPGACYAYGFTGCPICGSSCGTWGGARCRWDEPRKVRCIKGHVLPDADHPDDGAGYHAKDGRVHYIIGTWNAWATEQWTGRALPSLAHAYALTGDERYAERAAFFFDALASIYAESTSGSWDYPSRPPSGRFARPWYQVARTLVVYVDAYDLIYSSPALDKPSLRPRLEKTFPPQPTLQKRAVGTADAKGRSWAGMTRRDNVDVNLMQDAGYYCYHHSFSGMLHNGHADYMRGALAVGALLGIPEYVGHSVDSPYSIYVMAGNNCDRDGRYYETALGYALHARSLYLTFVEPLRNWRSERCPKGVDIFADPRMRSFYYLPDLVVQCAGHAPNFGDAGPDNRFRLQPAAPFSARDYTYAEWLYAGCTGPAKDEFARLLRLLARGDVGKARAKSSLKRWLLYHADPVPDGLATLEPDWERRVFGSWFLGQKGISILRDGREANAQAALLRFGPSLNHGDYDDLGLIYYAKGWQLTYEIGYGLGSTHVQVGWGSQTASHTLVTVNESSQRGGSGGSLYLFASLPSIKVMEADSPLSYASQDVTQYRRTVALVGAGRDQYLVDIFRVRGGHQHDYGIGVQTQDFTAQGIDLGPEEDGSLAGLENAWAERIGPDGDIIGHPNKPYWNPPPKNGYGFFYDMRRGRTDKPFAVDFALGGRNDAHFRIHALPEPDTETIVAKAPGLYPRNRKAAYLIARRKADAPLASAFASVMEPYALEVRQEGIDADALLTKLVEHQDTVKPIPGLRIVLLKGERVGDFMTFQVAVEQEGEFEIAAQILQASSYGTVRLLVDGKPLGKPFNATHKGIFGPVRVRFGKRQLAKGAHRFRFEMAQADAYFVGLASLIVQPWADANVAAAKAQPVLDSAERVPVQGDADDVAPVGVHVRRGGRDEYVLSAALTDAVHRAQTAAGELTWRGAVVFLACRDGQLDALATHGAWDVTLGGKRYGPERGLWTGMVVGLNYDERWVDVDAPIPQDVRAAGVYFSNPKYSRNTAYRIYRVQRVANGSRISLGPQPMLLGQGRVLQITPEGDLVSDVPHEYTRSVVGRPNARFFDGKLVTNGRGASTHVVSMPFARPLKLQVESAADFADGDTLYYYDVQPGDAVTVPTAWAWRRE